MSKTKSPDYDVLTSKPIDNDGKQKAKYTRVGAGWNVRKNGISISLDAMPLDGKLVLFPRDNEQSGNDRVREDAAPY